MIILLQKQKQKQKKIWLRSFFVFLKINGRVMVMTF